MTDSMDLSREEFERYAAAFGNVPVNTTALDQEFEYYHECRVMLGDSDLYTMLAHGSIGVGRYTICSDASVWGPGELVGMPEPFLVLPNRAVSGEPIHFKALRESIRAVTSGEVDIQIASVTDVEVRIGSAGRKTMSYRDLKEMIDADVLGHSMEGLDMVVIEDVPPSEAMILQSILDIQIKLVAAVWPDGKLVISVEPMEVRMAEARQLALEKAGTVVARHRDYFEAWLHDISARVPFDMDDDKIQFVLDECIEGVSRLRQAANMTGLWDDDDIVGLMCSLWDAKPEYYTCPIYVDIMMSMLVSKLLRPKMALELIDYYAGLEEEEEEEVEEEIEMEG